MAAPARNFSNCPIDYIDHPADFPPDFHTTTEHICGFNFPSHSPIGSDSGSQCCTRPNSQYWNKVAVSNGCFQYCTTEKRKDDFAECINRYFNGATLATVCNHVKINSGRKAKTNGLGRLIVVLLVLSVGLHAVR